MDQTYTLIGDLGGTNCRLRLMTLHYDDDHHEDNSANEKTIHEQRYSSLEFKSLESILIKFLHDHNIASTDHEYYPKMVVVCVAGPVSTVQRLKINSPRLTEEDKFEYGTFAHSTNLKWDMYSWAIAESLKLPINNVTMVNDFEAVGYGILNLKPTEYVQLTHNCGPKPEAPIAVIGPGTGLGEAYLTTDRKGGGYVVHPSEGGHSTYGPTSMEEFNLTQYIQAEFQTTHVSWERVCSGTGIKSIYRYFKHKEEHENPIYFAENINIYENENKPNVDVEPVLGAKYPAQAIFDKAKLGDKLCCQVVEIYLSALGREAGNLAAKLLPHGGIYIAGGMGAKIRWALEQPIPGQINEPKPIDTTLLLKNLHEKGRLKPFIENIPVYLVLIDEVGLIGCLFVAKRIGKAASKAQKMAKL
jgi:glucokinase